MRVRDGDGFTGVIEPAGVDTVDDNARVSRLQRSCVAAQQERLAPAEGSAVGEREVDSAGEKEAAEIEREAADVLSSMNSNSSASVVPSGGGLYMISAKTRFVRNELTRSMRLGRNSNGGDQRLQRPVLSLCRTRMR
jgi:hypothetical protein